MKKLLFGLVIFCIFVSSIGVFAFSVSDVFKFILSKETGNNEKSVENIENFEAPIRYVTIYGNNVAFVRRFGNFKSRNEESIVQLKLINFTKPIENSLFIYDDKGKIKEWFIHNLKKVKEIKKEYMLNFEEILNESLGRNILISYDNKTLSGKLTWFWNSDKGNRRIGIEHKNGILFINLDDVDEIFILDIMNISKRTKFINKTFIVPELVIKEISKSQGVHNVLISYLRSGATWNANYKLYLDMENKESYEGYGTLQSWAHVENNANEDWNDVIIKLVVGYPNMVPYYVPYKYGVPLLYEKSANLMRTTTTPAPGVAETLKPSFTGEYCIYTINEKTSINHSESKNFPIFSEIVKFKRKYLWDATSFGKDVYKIYEINNTLDVPWAEGVFSVYLGDNFEGQDKIEYTPKKSKVEVKVSKAPDVIVNKEILEKTTEKSYEYESKIKEKIGGRGYVRKTYYKVRLTIESHKKSDVIMEIKDEMQRGDEVNLISATIKPEVKLYSLKWDNIKIKGNEKKIIEYEYEVKNWYLG